MYKQFNTHAITSQTATHFMTLQDNVLGALKLTEQHFITPRTSLTIEKHLVDGMPIMGLYGECQNLAGAVVISHPDVTQKYDDDNPMVSGLCLTKVAVIEGLYVDPKFQRHGLGTRLVYEAAQMAVQGGRTHLSAEIAVENVASARTFAKNGFVEIAKFICPDDGAHVMTMQACAQTSVQTLAPPQVTAYTRG
jgi:ribosomal protein S18 acetylase RimI-like enzyme